MRWGLRDMACALRAGVVAVLLTLIGLPAWAQSDPIIVTWNTNTDAGPHNGILDGEINGTIPELTPLPLIRHTVNPHGSPAAHAHSSVNWSEAVVLDDDRFVSWGFETEIPYFMSEMVVHIRRSETGPKQAQIIAIIDGDETAPIHLLDVSPINQASGAPTTVTPDPFAYPDGITVTASIEFRLFGWDADSSGTGVFSFRNAGNSNPQRADPLITGRAIVIRGRPAQAELEAEKDVMVFSENGSGCDDLEAEPPTEPQHPAAIPGACIEYTISVANTGSVAAENITLTDALPANLSFQAAGLDANWGVGTDLITPSPGCPGCEVKVEDGVINANTTATLTIRAIVN